MKHLHRGRTLRDEGMNLLWEAAHRRLSGSKEVASDAGGIHGHVFGEALLSDGPRSAVARYDLALVCVASAGAARERGRSSDIAPLVREATDNLEAATRLDAGFTPAARLLEKLRG